MTLDVMCRRVIQSVLNQIGFSGRSPALSPSSFSVDVTAETLFSRVSEGYGSFRC